MSGTEEVLRDASKRFASLSIISKRQEGNMGIDIYVKNGKDYIYFEGLGSGTNFYEMRLAIQYSLENGEKGSRFPILQKTPDYETTFSMEQAITLKEEVETIMREKDNLQEGHHNRVRSIFLT